MNILFQLIIYSVFIGVGATLFMDIHAILIKRIFNIPSLDLAIVGRWIGHFRKGIFSHNNIIQAQKVNGELALGWFAHYAIGITFAFLLLLICGIEWVCKPTFWICITLGVATTAAPWFMMQPAFGFGIAASKTPNPTIARLRSLQAHAIYGFGLYLAAVLLSNIIK
ncbi:MAG: DUF2938 domain-containing protein [Sphingobacterium sp.]|jgi:hypothetical protein|nr:DUF2938 domain-containing protein [Sphingobacterium sp.]